MDRPDQEAHKASQEILRKALLEPKGDVEAAREAHRKLVEPPIMWGVRIKLPRALPIDAQGFWGVQWYNGWSGLIMTKRRRGPRARYDRGSAEALKLTEAVLTNSLGINHEGFIPSPSVVHLENKVLHCEDGPALVAGTTKVYAISGITLPERAVMDPSSLTIDEIMNEPNVERRRVMRHQFGEGRWLQELGAEVVHTDTVPTDKVGGSGCITRALLKDHHGNYFLVASDGSTDRVYYMQVRRCRTCSEAHAQIMPMGMRPEQIIMEA